LGCLQEDRIQIAEQEDPKRINFIQSFINLIGPDAERAATDQNKAPMEGKISTHYERKTRNPLTPDQPYLH
jgi:hypothetical protein